MLVTIVDTLVMDPTKTVSILNILEHMLSLHGFLSFAVPLMLRMEGISYNPYHSLIL